MSEIQQQVTALHQRKRRLTVTLFFIWLITSFGPAFMARDLSFEVLGWPLHFWLVAQGSVLLFILLVAVHAWLMNRWEAQEGKAPK